jgi:membrane protein
MSVEDVRPGPLDLSLAQWGRVLQGVGAAADRANLALISGGLAYFGLLAIVPAIAALVALLGVFSDPALIAAEARALRGIAPDAVVDTMTDQIARLGAAQPETLALSAVANLLLSFWSALQGARWGLIALTAVNRRAEQRSFFRRFIAAGTFTLYGIGLALVAVLAMAVAPLVLARLRLGADMESLLLILRWAVLGGAAVAYAFILYRWGPHRRAPSWRWIWPGALAAPALWVLASSALTFALREFPAFGAAYGSVASVLALLIWLYLTALVFLLGGALNAELEFFAAGKPAQPVTADEKIEPPIGADGGQKEVAR